MKKKILLFAFFSLLITISAIGQDFRNENIKCDLQTITNLRIHVDSLSDKIILDFLFSVDNSCQNNVEWSEASNGTLFWLADTLTKRFITLLKSNKNKLDTNWIIEEFKQPIDDRIDLVGIYYKINLLKDNDVIVQDILNSLKLAIKGSGLEIK